jgi:hypothetical protein
MLIYVAVTGYLVGVVTFLAFMWGTTGRHDVDQGRGFPVLDRQREQAPKTRTFRGSDATVVHDFSEAVEVAGPAGCAGGPTK